MSGPAPTIGWSLNVYGSSTLLPYGILHVVNVAGFFLHLRKWTKGEFKRCLWGSVQATPSAEVRDSALAATVGRSQLQRGGAAGTWQYADNGSLIRMLYCCYSQHYV